MLAGHPPSGLPIDADGESATPSVDAAMTAAPRRTRPWPGMPWGAVEHRDGSREPQFPARRNALGSGIGPDEAGD